MTCVPICLRRLQDCLRRVLKTDEEGIEEETIGLFDGGDRLELSRRQKSSHRQNGNGVSSSRPKHRKTLRAKDASYSESIIQDFRKDNIPTELATLYDLQEIIGIGTTSKVYKCKRRTKKEIFACKVIDKRKLNMEVESKDLLLDQLRKEIEILQHLSHVNIVEFQDVIETADKIFVVMELIQGGELFEYLLDRGPLPEDVAVHIMRQVMGAIAYMHERGVVHRDLKAENLLIVDPNVKYPTVKLIDFGFSTILRHNLTGSFLGTGGYLAPEIRQQRLYSESVDIWACGVLLYLLLSCRLPFNADVETLPSNRQQVERKFELSFPEGIWKTRSESVKNLLRRMLVTDPMRRYTAQQVIRHPWIIYGPSADIVKPGLLGPIRKENPQESSQIMDYGSTRTSNGPAPSTKPLAIPLDQTGMRQVRSSMNLERMLIPVNIISRTPPARRGGGPLRPSPTSTFRAAGGGGEVAAAVSSSRVSSAPITDRSDSGGGLLESGTRGGAGIGQKPVLVSYMPQTIHNSVAGDLSSTSNLSAKFTSDSKKGAIARRAFL